MYVVLDDIYKYTSIYYVVYVWIMIVWWCLIHCISLTISMMWAHACNFILLGRATEWNVSFVGALCIESDRSLLAPHKEMIAVVLLRLVRRRY
jgi:hypothetical protein